MNTFFDELTVYGQWWRIDEMNVRWDDCEEQVLDVSGLLMSNCFVSSPNNMK